MGQPRLPACASRARTGADTGEAAELAEYSGERRGRPPADTASGVPATATWPGALARPGKTKPVHKLPFGQESKGFMKDYIDERVTAVAVNLWIGAGGTVYLTVEGLKDQLIVELPAFRRDTVDLVPIFPEADTLAAAQARVDPRLLEALQAAQHGPVLFPPRTGRADLALAAQ